MSAETFVRYHVGDALTVLRTLPDASVDLVLSSPPFLALRSYLPADHPDKGAEMGSEPTPGAFIDALLDIVEECRRVLAPHGSLCFELGDTYSGSGGAGGDYNADGLRDGQQKFSGSAVKRRKNGVGDEYRPSRAGRLSAYNDERGNPDGMRDTTFQGANTRTCGGDGWPLDKSLCLIPELFRFALVYGFNPLTGRETPPWRARNVVRWCRPNPPVGSLGDKVRPATSDLLIACVGRKRYFDLDAVRTAPLSGVQPGTEVNKGRTGTGGSHWRGVTDGGARLVDLSSHPSGAPPLDHWWFDEVADLFEQDAWLIPTQGYPGSHYATWPEALCERPIKAMCPTRVCAVCGKPSERITEVVETDRINGNNVKGADTHSKRFEVRTTTTTTTTGWTDCGHDAWRAGVCLDPFAGSGTTLAVAHGHGRSAIGIDLDQRNAEQARQRVGMWLEIDGDTPLPSVETVTEL